MIQGPVWLGRVWVSSEDGSRETAIEFGVLLHDTPRSGAEGFVRLSGEVVDAEANRLFDGQALALAQLFQPTHFFI